MSHPNNNNDRKNVGMGAHAWVRETQKCRNSLTAVGKSRGRFGGVQAWGLSLSSDPDLTATVTMGERSPTTKSPQKMSHHGAVVSQSLGK